MILTLKAATILLVMCALVGICFRISSLDGATAWGTGDDDYHDHDAGDDDGGDDGDDDGGDDGDEDGSTAWVIIWWYYFHHFVISPL